jgi:hypothetical protein
MNLAKFVSLLHRQALFFARADILANIDPYEGSFARQNLMFDHISFSDLPDQIKQSGEFPFKDEEQWQAHVSTMKMIRHAIWRMRHKNAVNCWHMNNYESAAMWSLYDNSGEGVAVVSTFESLCKSFDKNEEMNVYIGEVQYVDYEQVAIPTGNAFYPLMYKRKSFEHEKEVRAIVAPNPDDGVKRAGEDWIEHGIKGAGLYVATDLDQLIHAIYVSPSAQDWVAEMIQDVADKYNVNKPVRKSVLNDPGLH